MGVGLGYQVVQGNLWGDESILKLDCGDGRTAVYIYKDYFTVHLQWVSSMVCKLQFNEPVTEIVTRVSFEEDPILKVPRFRKDTIHAPNDARSEL